MLVKTIVSLILDAKIVYIFFLEFKTGMEVASCWLVDSPSVASIIGGKGLQHPIPKGRGYPRPKPIFKFHTLVNFFFTDF